MELKQSIGGLATSFDRIARQYDSETSTFTHQLIEYVNLQNLLIALPEQSKHARILDLGGGTGKYAIALSELGYDITLSDISQESLEVAREKIAYSDLKIPIIHSDAENVPCPDGSFDFVLMLGGVISYTPHPRELLNECYRLLRKGGGVWLDFLNTIGWACEIGDPQRKAEVALEEEKLIQMNDWDFPARLFAPRAMETMVQESGLSIKSKFGLLLLSASMPLSERYRHDFDDSLLEKFKTIELALSRNAECYGSSWCCSICATKTN